MDRFKRASACFSELCRVMARLRSSDGCAWDREQTMDSLKPYLIEEAYETLDAIESNDASKHREELGDLLLQIVFQAEIQREAKRFDIADVAEGITQKLIRRHPHVFGQVKADDAKGALKSWETVKATERNDQGSRLDGIPRNLPALLMAWRTGEKAATIGFDWPDVSGVVAKVEEEWQELRATFSPPTGVTQRIAEELGDLLFALANLARHLDVDPESALRQATDRFSRRFKFIEKRLKESGKTETHFSIEQLESLWEEAKQHEKHA